MVGDVVLDCVVEVTVPFMVVEMDGEGVVLEELLEPVVVWGIDVFVEKVLFADCVE